LFTVLGREIPPQDREIDQRAKLYYLSSQITCMNFFVRSGFNRDDNGYIKVPTDPEMCHTAWEKAKRLGVLTNSIRSGMGNLVGYLGQLAVEKAIIGMKVEETYDYDLVCDGRRIEVKTKDRTVPPQPFYECSIAKYNPSQATDYYIFASTYRLPRDYNYSLIYILGYIEPSEYFKKATHLKKGDIDYQNNFTVKADCYNLPIRDLHGFP
jgi:hypothetical protein